MNGDDKLKGTRKAANEIRLSGLAVSRGVSIGRVVCLHGRNHQFYKSRIESSAVGRELSRLDDAFALSDEQLAALIAVPGTYDLRSEIFGTHRLVLNDASFRSKIVAMIRDMRINAEWAIANVADEYVSRLKSLADENLRDRHIDVSDIVDRLLAALTKTPAQAVSISNDSVIAASELRPSTLMEIDGVSPAGCISEHGGWTSHSFIFARELGLPAVTGLQDLLLLVETGDTVIVDGYNGEVIVNPKAATLEEFRSRQSPAPSLSDDESAIGLKPLKTIDGRAVTLSVNADSPKQIERAKRLGAVGVGLYRSESLFGQFKRYPSEDHQFAAYSKVAAIAGEGGVKVRTFDLSIGQTSPFADGQEKNPALGLRGIRLSLRDRKQFLTQLRAILRSARIGKVGVTLPMISGLNEVTITREMIAEAEHELDKQGIEYGKVELGVMVEVPAIVIMIDRVLAEVDYVCLGTNDLVQYMLGVDRDNELVADCFRSLDPAVMIAVGSVLAAGTRAGKPVIVCGEMAGSAFYTPILLGLGATELSMNVHSIQQVQRVVCGIAYEEALHLAGQVKACSTADGVEAVILAAINRNWSHLYPADFPRVRKI